MVINEKVMMNQGIAALIMDSFLPERSVSNTDMKKLPVIPDLVKQFTRFKESIFRVILAEAEIK